MKLRAPVVICSLALCWTSKALAQAPQVSLVSSFTSITLPPQVTVVPVRYKVDNGFERSMDVPLSCSQNQCTGEVVVVDSLRGTGRVGFTIARSTDTLAAFPLNVLQERKPLAMGKGHTLVVRNGEVWSFGWNHQGQLGLGYKDTLFHPQLRKIPGLNRIVSVYTGWEFSVALDSAGDVWTWGSAYQGGLGNGIRDAAEVAPYSNSTSWKYNSYYSNPIPSKVLVGNKVQAMAVCAFSVGVVDSVGNVWVWGRNQVGQLGLGSTSSIPTTVPTLNPTFRGIRRLAMAAERKGSYYSSTTIGVDQNGLLWGTGSSIYGRLGPLTGTVSTPRRVELNMSGHPGLSMPVDLVASDNGFGIEYMRLATGERQLLAIGSQSGWWFSNPSYSGQPLPSLTRSARAVAAGAEHSIFSLQPGVSGQSMLWARILTSDAAIQREDGSVLEATWYTAGIGTGYAPNTGVSMDADQKTVHCWGDQYICSGNKLPNASGQRAKVVQIDSSNPTPASIVITTKLQGLVLPPWVKVITVLASIDGTENQSFDVPLTCGSNQCSGEIRFSDWRGTSTQSFTIARSTDTLAAFPLNLLQERKQLAMGKGHTLVVRNGEVWGFGWNHQGQLGLGYKDTLFHPQLRKIPGLKRIVSVYAGWEFSVALDSAGDVWTWGSAYQGALGNGMRDSFEVAPSSPTSSWRYNGYYSNPIPSKVLTGKKVQAMAVGAFSVGAVDSAGNVWVWGRNNVGQLGLGSTSSKPTTVPTLNPTFRGIRRLAMAAERKGSYYSSTTIGVDQNGLLWGTGSSIYGRLGPLTGTVSTPRRVELNMSGHPGLSMPVDLVASDNGFGIEYMRLATGERQLLAIGSQSGWWFSNPSYSGQPLPSLTRSARAVAAGAEHSIFSGKSGVSGQPLIWARTSTNDEAIQREDGSILEATWYTAGIGNGYATNTGASLDADQKTMHCWGDPYICAGNKTANAFGQRAKIVQIDSSDDLNIIWESSVSDTVFVPTSITMIAPKYSLGGVDDTAQSIIECQDSICYADLFARTSDGKVRGRRVFVRKVKLTLSDVSIIPAVGACKGCQKFVIRSLLLGDWSVRVLRLDQGDPIMVHNLQMGRKSKDSLVFDYSGLLDGRSIHDGIYTPVFVWSDFQQRDSLIIDYLMGKKYEIPVYRGLQVGDFYSKVVFEDGSKKLIQVHRSPAAGAVTGSIVVSAGIVDTVLSNVGVVDIGAEQISDISYPLFVKAWPATNVFQVTDAGPVRGIQISSQYFLLNGLMVTEVQWNANDADSVVLQIVGDPNSKQVFSSPLSANAKFTFPAGKTISKLVKASFWRVGQVTTGYYPVKYQ